MQKADSILNFVDIPNFSVMDFERSLLLIKIFLYKKTLNCEHRGYSFKTTKNSENFSRYFHVRTRAFTRDMEPSDKEYFFT